MAKKPPQNSKDKGLSAEDNALWKAITTDIDPLDDRQGQDFDDFENPAPIKARPVKPKPPPDFPVKKPHPAPKAVPQLDLRTELRLKKGQIPIDARLDLHGHTQEMAYTALKTFILQSSRAGFRCLLVITGKGSIARSQEEDFFAKPQKGVLKTMLPLWLTDPAIAPYVLKHYGATQKDGGSGAYYIYLKRIRNY